MAGVVRFHQTGGPEVLRIEELEVGAPGPGPYGFTCSQINGVSAA